MFSLAALMMVPAAFAAPWGPPHPFDHPLDHPSGRPFGSEARALYFLENNPAGSSIVALSIGPDGSISDPIRTSTKGLGAFELNSTTGAAVPVDTMGGQDAVVVSENLLFTLNAGSNTVVLFTIDPKDASHPTMVGKPVSTHGDFPMSVAYSAKLNTACVVNTGVVAGVQCFSVNPTLGLTPAGPFRQFSKEVVNQTSPPMGPPGETGDIYFTPDSSAVLVSVKGGVGTPPSPGFIVAYPVVKGVVSTDPIHFQSPNIALDFGATWITKSRLLLTDAASGVALLNVDEDLAITEISNTTIPGQGATCWADYDASLNQAYAMDAGAPYIYLINPSTGALEGHIAVESSLMGVLDEVILDEKMYLLTGVNGIVVVDLKKKEQVQFLNLTNFSENRQYYQGMALFTEHAHAHHW
nr:hypothetical protein CFP56_04152 [Quercus suber]